MELDLGLRISGCNFKGRLGVITLESRFRGWVDSNFEGEAQGYLQAPRSESSGTRLLGQSE